MQDTDKQMAINLFLGNFVPEAGRPALWELDSDNYLHFTAGVLESGVEPCATGRRVTVTLLLSKRMVQFDSMTGWMSCVYASMLLVRGFRGSNVFLSSKSHLDNKALVVISSTVVCL